MVNVLFNEDSDVFKSGIVITVYDPACGTGGMLSESENYIKDLNPGAEVVLFGQDFNDESYAMCKSDMLIKGQEAEHIIFGDSFTQDGHYSATFQYMLANPPFGVEWKKQKRFIEKEHQQKGFNGRFGPGLPRISDGSLLFLLHMISKMKSDDKGSRIAIVFNGSPLFNGDAGQGESEIRKWIIENDLLEGIIALPEQMFYNTGIHTYIWILTNRKNDDISKGPIRKGKVQLVNAVNFYEKMTKSLGDKRNYMSEEQIKEVIKIYGNFRENEDCLIFNNEDFGYKKITVERPLKLNFKIHKERVEKIKEETAFQNLVKTRKKGKEGEREIRIGLRLQNKILFLLSNPYSSQKGDITNYENSINVNRDIFNNLYKDRDLFEKDLITLFRQNNINVRNSVFNAIIRALSERDDSAIICKDSKGKIEPDPELRDHENVPIREDIYEYFEREVKSHVPDAWIDESNNKIGYEIPFTRYFYKFTPLRPSMEIMEEIKDLEKSIKVKLNKLMFE